MGETVETGSPETTVASPALNRRRLLKTAAAAGVGVAAWSAPSITTVGFTPAYGATCSVPSEVILYTSTTSNTAGGCSGDLELQGSVTFGPGDIYSAAPTDTGCADGVQTITFTGTGTTPCRIKTLDLYDNQGAVTDSFPQPAGSEGATIPQIPQAGNTSKRWGLDIECVPEGGCFPASTTTTAAP